MYRKQIEIYEWIRVNPNSTEREIAEGVGLKKTPYSRRIILDLLEDGHVARFQDPDAVRLTYRYYVQETERLL